MGIKLTREFTIHNGDQDIIFNPEVDKITESRQIGLICDSGRCAARHEGKTTFLTWDEVQAEKDPNSLPVGFSDVIKIYPDPLSHEYVLYFCGPQCARDFLMYSYVPAKTPQQRLAELKVNPETQSAIDALEPQLDLPFPEPVEIEPVTDATGVAND